jgi:hypothetical protein
MSCEKLLMAQFDLHNVLYNNVLAGVTDDESNRVVAQNMNTVKWLAGHLLWAQWNLANISEVDLFIPDEALNSPITHLHPIFPFDQTLGGLWAFINHHQAFTIGQIAILRKGLGKAAMSYSKSI